MRRNGGLLLSDNERIIMQLLWREGRPLTRAEILKGTPDRSWNPASIHLILNSMISKGVVETDEEKKYGRTYAPTVSMGEVCLSALEGAIPGMEVTDLFGAVLDGLMERGEMTEELIADLGDVLGRKRNQFRIKGGSKKKKK